MPPERLLGQGSTYDWAFVVSVLNWELAYDLSAWEVVFTHALIVGVSQAVFEPHLDFTELPLHLFKGSVIQGN